MSTRRLVGLGMLVTLLVAGVLSFYASRHPDGLERVAHGLGFAASEKPSTTSGSLLAGYHVRGVADGRLSGGLAGVLGVLVVGLVMSGLVLYVRRRSARDARRD
jgi:cobalt/nickel transport protein